MLYIVTALKPEAQAFVDKFRLKKQRLQNFTFFINEDITLVISGLGVQNAREASEFILENFEIQKDDKFLNIGICGANSKHHLGKLLEIASIKYADKLHTLDASTKHQLTCLDSPASDELYEIVDMESFGFYDTLCKSIHREKIAVFKVVSDNFKPHTVTKEMTKTLVFKAIDEIFTRLEK